MGPGHDGRKDAGPSAMRGRPPWGLPEVGLLLAGAAFSVALCGGYFLSDDFVQLANFGHWSAQGRLAEEVAAKLGASIDGVNGFWRPLTYATYAVNFAAGGADPRGWLAVNLALHLANAVLVAALVSRLSPTPAHANVAPLFGGVLFFALASGWEAALWIACRYDTLSTFFVLLGAWWFAGGKPARALVATLLALMSKESGAVAFVLVGFIALAQALDVKAAPMTLARHLARVLWPFVALGLAYIALRIAIFGSATGAYVGVSIDLTSPAHWSGLVESGIAWGRVNFPGPAGLRPAAIAVTLAILIAGLVNTRHDRAALARMAAVIASIVVALALVLPFLPMFDPAGLGGRLFYLPGALLAIALGLALQSASGRAPSARWRHGTTLTLAAALTLAHLHWMWLATREYRAVHSQMRALAADITRLAASGPSPPVLALIPDTMGRAAFGRNAQAGLVLPPVQRGPVSDRVLVQVDREIGELPAKIATGLFEWLARHELFELRHGGVPARYANPTPPSGYFCWSAPQRRFVAMPPGPGALAEQVLAAYEQAGCRDGPPPR